MATQWTREQQGSLPYKNRSPPDPNCRGLAKVDHLPKIRRLISISPGINPFQLAAATNSDRIYRDQ